MWLVVLGHLTILKDENLVKVHHSVQAMSDCEQRGRGKRVTNCVLNELEIDLVETQELLNNLWKALFLTTVSRDELATAMTFVDAKVDKYSAISALTWENESGLFQPA